VSSLRFLSPALASWVRSLPSTGLFEPLGEGRFRLRVSQTRLAEELGYNGRSGALSRRFKRLETAGVLISRRPLVLRLDEETPLPVSTDISPRRVSVPRAGGGLEVADPPVPVSGDERTTVLWSLLERCLDDRLEIIGSRVLDLLFSPPAEPAPTGDVPAAGTGDPARVERADARSFPRGGPRVTRDLENSVQTAIYLSPAQRAERAHGAIRAERTVPELRQLLTPLLVECTSRGLPGVSNMPGLLAAVEQLDDEEVARGVAFVVHQIRSGIDVRSPFGLLAALASRGSLS
jgi:hypothetical protein